MSWQVLLNVPTAPIAQPRHKAGKVRNGRRRGRTVLYLPETHPVHAYKGTLILRAREAVRDARTAGKLAGDFFPHCGPMSLSVVFLMPRQKGAEAGRERRWHDERPDTDNLIKSLKDSLTGIVWDDDCRVVIETAAKAFHDALETPRVVASIQPAHNLSWALGAILAGVPGVRQ